MPAGQPSIVLLPQCDVAKSVLESQSHLSRDFTNHYFFLCLAVTSWLFYVENRCFLLKLKTAILSYLETVL